MENLRIPSKTFLLGEYAVLYGGQAIVLVHPPFFRVQKSNNSVLFHKDSPAARLMRKNSLIQDFEFIDPHGGRGGFGGSTAEVVASFKSKTLCTIEELLKDYLNLFSDQGVKPSGADLYAQWLCANGEVLKNSSIVLYNKKSIRASESLIWPFKDVAIMIFKRPKKTKTHKHLSSLKLDSSHFEELVEITKLGVDYILNEDSKFFEQIESFTLEQKKLSLIDEVSFQEVSKIKKIPYVLTARACGALGVDVVSVFCSLKKDYNKEDLDKLKAEIVDSGFNYVHIATLDQGDFISD